MNLSYKPILVLFALLISMQFASAHCALCTGAAAVGVTTARYYGVDDSIVGLLIGALIASSALWFNRFLKNKNIKFKFQEALLVIFSFLSVVIPFYYTGLITNFEMVKSMPEHHSLLGLGVYGIDKLLFGIITGTLVTWFVFSISDAIKEKRGKVLFPYQSLAFMAIAIAVISIILYAIVS